MFTKFTIPLFLLIVSSSFAQDTITFESFNLEPSKFLDGSTMPGFFFENNLILHNDYNKDWKSWSGWAISSMKDTVTEGFTNEFSAIPGAGASNSNTYAVAYLGSGENILKTNDPENIFIGGFYVTNSTYAYLSMKNGDAFSKKFGGITGNDPDFFKLTVRGYLNGTFIEKKAEIFLSNFLPDNRQEDFILNSWKYVDLTDFGNTDSLSFTLTSSDNGAFGMNTPAYFCIDNVNIRFTVGHKDLLYKKEKPIIVSPNPFTDFFEISLSGTKIKDQEVSIFDQYGKLVLSKSTNDGTLQVTNLPNGVYILKISQERSSQSVLLMKM